MDTSVYQEADLGDEMKKKEYKFNMKNHGVTRCPECGEDSMFVCRFVDADNEPVGVDFNCVNCGAYEYYKQVNRLQFDSLKERR